MEMISSLIGAYFYAITHLLSELKQTQPLKPNQVQTGIGENGLACGIVTLSVFCLEATLNRVRNERGDTADRTSEDFISNTKYVKLVLGDSKLADYSEELFAIRDTIAHNHIWSAEIDWNGESGTMQFVDEPQLVAGYGDNRFHRVTNPETRKTNRLGLNVFPNRIWRRDAFIVFKTLFLLLKAFENANRNYVYFSHIPYKFGDDVISIEEIYEQIEVPTE
jgi:hypothetical protein